MTLNNLPPTPSEDHLELWAREGEGNIVRLDAGPGVAYAIAPVVSFMDPCAIDDQGNLVWTAAAQRDCFGHPCVDDGERQRAADAIALRMRQLVEFQAPILAFTHWTMRQPAGPSSTRRSRRPHGWRSVATSGPARRAPTAETPSSSRADPRRVPRCARLRLDHRDGQLAGGIQFSNDYELRDVRELWLTETAARVVDVDPDEVDCQASPHDVPGPDPGAGQSPGRRAGHGALRAGRAVGRLGGRLGHGLHEPRRRPGAVLMRRVS